MMPQLAFTLVTLVVGWIALSPMRRCLGAMWYHLAAFPVGLLGWTFLAGVAMTLRVGYTWWLAAVSLTGYAAIIFVAGVVVSRSSRSERRVQWWTYLGWAALLGAVAAIVANSGIAVFSHDGWAQYELYSWRLFDTGTAGLTMLGHRMIVLNAFHAAYHLFGGEFASFVYPLLSVHIALLVGAATLRAAGSARRTAAGILAVAIVSAMVGHVTYLFMSIYVHSHMPSALYLLIAGIGIWMAVEGGTSGVDDAETTRGSWLLLSGLAVAGLMLSRPDGLAYAMAAVLLFGATFVRYGLRPRSADTLFGPMIVLPLFYVVSTIVNRGLWTSPKIDAVMILAFCAGYTAIWAVLRFVPVSRITWLTRGTTVPALIIAVEATGLAWLFRVLGEQAPFAIETALKNLLGVGGWRSFWPLMTAMIIVSLALAVRTGRDRFTTYTLFYASQFFVIAFVVHGVTHPGRLGWGDSFNRVAFHVVPLLWWYIGLYGAGLLTLLFPRGEDRIRA